MIENLVDILIITEIKMEEFSDECMKEMKVGEVKAEIDETEDALNELPLRVVIDETVNGFVGDNCVFTPENEGIQDSIKTEAQDPLSIKGEPGSYRVFLINSNEDAKFSCTHNLARQRQGK